MNGQKGEVMLGTVIGALVGGIAGTVAAKSGQVEAIAMHYPAPSGANWYAIGFPSVKTWYIISGNYAWQFFKTAFPKAYQTVKEGGTTSTPIPPSDWTFGGTLTDNNSTVLPS